ncbi:hypothetical protein KSS87_021770 [Heliosperma pusillum]|nr:hypothetical protein KSS87_021770 [Heliosperma pusillum]
MVLTEWFTQLSASVATLVCCWTIYEHSLPCKLRNSIESITARCSHKLLSYFSPYLDITFDEYNDDRFSRNEIYSTIQNYLSDKSSMEAKSMKADYIKDGKSLLLSLGDNEEVLDEYKGVKVSWCFNTEVSNRPTFSFYSTSDDKRYYKLVFHNRDRKFVLSTYLPYVLEEGEAIAVRKRTRKLFTNAGNDGPEWNDRGTMWSHIEFKHPAKYDKLAMEQLKKQTIIDDLMWFKSSKDYYEEIGKPWKRGYLLYGPPGTGKSTLVAAIANLLDYDIYDLELTSVKDNMQLRRLLTETTSKSIILIEDIDCSLDLTGQRKSKKEDETEENEKNPIKKIMEKEGESEKKGSEVTLSGLLNFIDGIWSCCGEERIIVFTTNYIDRLDPALIRRGRMDVHIELSYCGFEAFQILAKNYLKLESHPLFESIGELLGEVEMTPADVAENLMPRSMNTNTDACLQNLVAALENAKKKKMVKSDETNHDEGGDI